MITTIQVRNGQTLILILDEAYVVVNRTKEVRGRAWNARWEKISGGAWF